MSETNPSIIEKMRDDISDLKSTQKVIISKLDGVAGALEKHADKGDDERGMLIKMMQSKADKEDLMQLIEEKNRILAKSEQDHGKIFDLIEKKVDKCDANDTHKEMYAEIGKINGNMWKLLTTALFSAVAAVGSLLMALLQHLPIK